MTRHPAVGCWLLAIALLATAAFAQPTDWFSAQNVKTQLNVSGTIQLTRTGADPLVDSLRADILFFPRSSPTTAIRSLEAEPAAVTLDDRIRYTWKRPTSGTLTFGYTTLVETSSNAPPILATIPWPTTFPASSIEYTHATTHIDSSHPAIIAQANYLARNQRDLASLVGATAAWVKNNVTYNLSTLTAEVSQKASWVLEHQTGVCDEITSLFIALLRSLGIPAKFVSGIAYTASPQFPQGWGAHGWAEVYFPGTGWVPYDPTFGEYGWVDPSHIALKESLDPQEPTSLYEWKARDVDITVSDLRISADLVEHKGITPRALRMTARPLRDRAGFGSHNALVVEIENPTAAYRSVELTLSRVNDLTILDGEHKQVTLPPNSKRNAFWHVKVNDNLNIQYQYEIPLHAHTIDNQTAETAFHSGRYDIVYSAQDIESAITALEPTTDTPFTLGCTLTEDTIADSQTLARCVLTSNFDKPQTVTLCRATCNEVQLGPLSRVPLEFPIIIEKTGVQPVTITAKTLSHAESSTLTVVRLDSPRVKITPRLALPATYGAILPLTFTVARDSLSVPHNLTIDVDTLGAEATLQLGNLESEQEVTINIPTDQLWQSEPNIKITATYADAQGHTYTGGTKTTVSVSGVPWYKSILGSILGVFGI